MCGTKNILKYANFEKQNFLFKFLQEYEKFRIINNMATRNIKLHNKERR